MKTWVSGEFKKKEKKRNKNPEIFSLCTTAASRLRGGRGGGKDPGKGDTRVQIPLHQDVNLRGALTRSATGYVLGAWQRLWGWSCCCFWSSCTASCWLWSDVDSLLLNGATQLAGMISPVKEKKGLKWTTRATVLTFITNMKCIEKTGMLAVNMKLHTSRGKARHIHSFLHFGFCNLQDEFPFCGSAVMIYGVCCSSTPLE